jgi:hypothetical protein
MSRHIAGGAYTELWVEPWSTGEGARAAARAAGEAHAAPAEGEACPLSPAAADGGASVITASALRLWPDSGGAGSASTGGAAAAVAAGAAEEPKAGAAPAEEPNTGA